MQALPGKAVKKVPGETAYCHHLPLRHPFRTPSKGVALSHHFSTPSEGVREQYSELFLPTECSERFPLHPLLFTPSEGVVFSHHFPTPSEGVKQASSDMAFSLLFSVQTHQHIIPAKSCDHALSML